MKPLPIFVSLFFICLIIVILLPQLGRIHLFSGTALPVSVTAYKPLDLLDIEHTAAGAPVLDMPQSSGKFLANPTYPGLNDFSASLMNGRADDVVGVYVPGIFALPVEQQPAGQPDFVAHDHNMLTQFGMPKEYGAIGILAHNYLSGSRFTQLGLDQDVVVVFGDGHAQRYQVAHISSFQALKPNSPFSNFINLSDPARRVQTSAELFKSMYTTKGQLVFQTCIEEDGESSWGRIFVVATPIETLQLSIPKYNEISSLN